MDNNVSINLLKEVGNFIEENFGLHFPEERFKDLTRALSGAAKEKGIEIEKYITKLLLGHFTEEDIKALVACLTIGETYFFRDRNLFKMLRERILPPILIKKRYSNKTLKIWSAGCSSGEEAYSIAILLKELIPDYEAWNIDIVATDINETFLNKAKNGIYSEWSFRGNDLDFKNRYFLKGQDNSYEINRSIAKLVKFYNLNLADKDYIINNQRLQNFDIIFCRNVLIYFSLNQGREIINRFYNTLTDGGWLIVAPTESLFLNHTSFVPMNFDDVFLYEKSSKKNSIANKNKFAVRENVFIHDDKKKSLITEVKGQFEENNSPTTELEVLDTNSIEESVKEQILEGEYLEKIAWSLANDGKLEEAIKLCKRAILMDKINPTYYHLVAKIYQEQGNINEAISYLKKAIFLEPQFIIAYFELGNLNLREGKSKEALKNFQNAQELLKNLDNEQIIPHSEDITSVALNSIISNIIDTIS